MVAGFAHAPVTKGLIITVTITSVLVSLFQLKPFFHLQLDPHIYIHHQWYRLVSQHFASTNSSELFLVLLLFYNAGVKVERMFGTYKYASFLVVMTSLYTVVQVVLLGFSSRLLFHQPISLTEQSKAEDASTHWLATGRSPAGPWGPLSAILYQYQSIIPHLWSFQVGHLTFTDQHISVYSLALLLAISQPSSTLFCATLGILSSALYRSNRRLQSYRIPLRLYRILALILAPWIGQTKLPPRSWRVEAPQRRTLQAREARLAEHTAAIANASRFSGVGMPTLASLLRRRTAAGGGTVLPVRAQPGVPLPGLSTGADGPIGGWNDVPPAAPPQRSGPGRPP